MHSLGENNVNFEDTIIMEDILGQVKTGPREW